MSATEGEVYTAVIYARVSTDDKGQTNETQIRDVTAYCERMGWKILDVYSDEQTATNDKRPGFRELKGRISEGDVDFVVARNQDRISRELLDYQSFIDYCNRFRVRVRYSDNSAAPETVEGVIIDSLQSGLAKADNMKRSANTKAGMETAKLRGIHCGRPLAFCWSDEVALNKAKIQTEGEHRTVIQSESVVMDYAEQGFTISETARSLGVSFKVFKAALLAKGLYEKFEVARVRSRAKGMACKRVPEPVETAVERVVSE
ncbi:MAG: recombinase family protein [Candidatus Methanomethylophilaceae archaeon]|nr:recombinase family protein [Candidatus Methanomethylophilaceae archaeon]